MCERSKEEGEEESGLSKQRKDSKFLVVSENEIEDIMDFWPEFLASSWGREFVAGGFGGIAGIISGYPLDTLRIRQQQNSNSGSALSILRRIIAAEGPGALYRGMAAPLASVTFQVMALPFQFSLPFF